MCRATVQRVIPGFRHAGAMHARISLHRSTDTGSSESPPRKRPGLIQPAPAERKRHFPDSSSYCPTPPYRAPRRNGSPSRHPTLSGSNQRSLCRNVSHVVDAAPGPVVADARAGIPSVLRGPAAARQVPRRCSDPASCALLGRPPAVRGRSPSTRRPRASCQPTRGFVEVHRPPRGRPARSATSPPRKITGFCVRCA